MARQNRPAKPKPTQAELDRIAAEKAAGTTEQQAETDAAEPVDNTPRPTQAELDAMRAGGFNHYKSR